MDQINKDFTEQIKLKSQDSAFNTLSEILQLNKEAVYRRLRGQVPFLYSEAALIAQKLNISLDNLNHISPDNYTFYSETPQSQANEEGYVDFFLAPEKHLSELFGDGGTLNYISTTIPLALIVKYKHLSKFRYFKWMHENRGLTPVKEKFSEIDFDAIYNKIPSKLLYFTREIKSAYLISELMFEHYIRYIRHFKKAGIIDDNDIVLLKKDLLDLINEFEAITASGSFPSGAAVEFYLTDLFFESSFGYYEHEQKQISLAAVFGMNYILSYNLNIFNFYKKAFIDMKDYASQISVTGSVYRKSFIDEQRRYIDEQL